MILFPRAVRVYVATESVNMRRSFDGLMAEVRSVLALDPLSGHVFAFINRRRNRLKLLWWDGSGLILCTKRLEKSRFSWPRGEGKSTALRSEELMALMSGLEVREKRGWYRR